MRFALSLPLFVFLPLVGSPAMAAEEVDAIESTLAESGDPGSVPFALEMLEKLLAQL